MSLETKHTGETYLLTGLIGGKARWQGKTIGKLADVIAVDGGKAAEVTHLLIERPFGYKSLMIPWEKVEKLESNGQTTLAISRPDDFEGEPGDGQVRLRDHLLDKKVLDSDDDEVEVAYDIKLARLSSRLYVTGVDCSRAGFLRRIGLGRVANFIRGVAATIKDDSIPWSSVQPLPPDLGRFSGALKLNLLKAKLPQIHPVDMADILEELDPDSRVAIFKELETDHASETLTEVEPRVQRSLVSSLPVERVAELVDEMTPAQAADVLAALPSSDSDAILEKVDPAEATKIHTLIDKHDLRIADFATTHCITFPPATTVSELVLRFRKAALDAEVIMYVYVTDADNHLLGVVDIKEILQAELHDTLEKLMTSNLITLDENETVSDAYKLFARYSFRAIPIVGERDVFKGAIPYRDIMQLSHRLL
jgi:CBS domain-containing protein